MTAILDDTRALVDAAKLGDRDAFGHLYGRYRQGIYRFIVHRIRDPHTAEDLCQDVFRRALTAIARYEHRGIDVGAWLTTVARNIVADHYKSAPVRTTTTYSTDWISGDDPDDDRWITPEAWAVHRVDAATLTAALGRLNPGQRRCLELRFLRGLSVAETAQVLGRQEGAVKALTWRAIGALRRDPALEALR